MSRQPRVFRENVNCSSVKLEGLSSGGWKLEKHSGLGLNQGRGENFNAELFIAARRLIYDEYVSKSVPNFYDRFGYW